MKSYKKIAIYSFILVTVVGTISCAGKKEAGEEADAVGTVAENASNALDVLLGESDEDLLIMGENGSADEQEMFGGNGLPIEGEGSEIIPGPVIVYYNSQDFSHLMYEETAVSSITPESVLTALAAHHIVTIDTKHNAFGMQDTEDGRKCLFLDLNRKFSDYMGTMEAESEKIVLAALTDTFLRNYDAELMYITVEGKALKTAHNIYLDAFTWSDYEAEEEKNVNRYKIDKKDEEK